MQPKKWLITTHTNIPPKNRKKKLLTANLANIFDINHRSNSSNNGNNSNNSDNNDSNSSNNSDNRNNNQHLQSPTSSLLCSLETLSWLRFSRRRISLTLLPQLHFPTLWVRRQHPRLGLTRHHSWRVKVATFPLAASWQPFRITNIYICTLHDSDDTL